VNQQPCYGFIGLGNMGAPIATNMAKAGFELLAYDQAGSAARAPAGAIPVESLAAVATQAESIFVCVPDGKASLAIANDLLALPQRRCQTVIDLSTTGIAAAKQVHAVLASGKINYIDCPVSGGKAGARAGTITVIWAGSAQLLEQHRAILAAMSGNIFHVGEQAGQGQAMKLLNNFLSATAMAATSEATLFGLSQGLDLSTMLAVLNVSTGRNTASSDKFPNRIVTGTFDAGFYSQLMTKDVQLYMQSVSAAGTPDNIGQAVDQIWQQMDAANPGGDITEIYSWLREQYTKQ